jgi:hypothetical protein
MQQAETINTRPSENGATRHWTQFQQLARLTPAASLGSRENANVLTALADHVLLSSSPT